MVPDLAMNGSSWEYATEMVRRFLAKPARLQHLMERLPVEEDGGKRRACQALLYGTVRHLRLLEDALAAFLKKKPKPKLYSRLLVASFEIFSEPEKRALIVDHAVERIKKACSRHEAGLANAVLRKVGPRLDALRIEFPETADGLARRFSYPNWMVDRWVGQFGIENTVKLLEWNEREPDLIVRSLSKRADAQLLEVGFEATEWPRYFRLTGRWSDARAALADNLCYVQNPGARAAVELAAKGMVPGGRVLDLCAAPGGKGIVLSNVGSENVKEIVSVDLPGPRLERLRDNIAQFGKGTITIVPSDVFALSKKEIGLFDVVLLDAPCSNTGVMQRKIDAKWRQRESDLAELVTLQRNMLGAASRFVKAGGSLVYSTCSIENLENRGVANSFAEQSATAFELVDEVSHYPWEAAHDGAAAFRFARR